MHGGLDGVSWAPQAPKTRAGRAGRVLRPARPAQDGAQIGALNGHDQREQQLNAHIKHLEQHNELLRGSVTADKHRIEHEQRYVGDSVKDEPG